MVRPNVDPGQLGTDGGFCKARARLGPPMTRRGESRTLHSVASKITQPLMDSDHATCSIPPLKREEPAPALDRGWSAAGRPGGIRYEQAASGGFVMPGNQIATRRRDTAAMQPQLQRASASTAVWGTVASAIGLYFLLVGLKVLPPPGEQHAPAWIVACAGLVFLLAGVAIII